MIYPFEFLCKDATNIHQTQQLFITENIISAACFGKGKAVPLLTFRALAFRTSDFEVIGFQDRRNMKAARLSS
jgi:hypothetical protein